MESQIHQFDSSLKQGQSAQKAFANTLEDTWGKGSKGAMRSDEVAKPNVMIDKFGGNLDFGNDIYGDKNGAKKFESKPNSLVKDDFNSIKKEAAIKEDFLRGNKKDKAATGNMLEDKANTGGKIESNQNGENSAENPMPGKEVKDGGAKSKLQDSDNQSGDSIGLTPMPGKEVKDGGDKSKFGGNDTSLDNSGLIPAPDKEIKDGGEKSAVKPGKDQQQDTEKGPIKFFADKPGQKAEMPSIYGTEVPGSK